jgi:hypothetical protein
MFYLMFVLWVPATCSTWADAMRSAGRFRLCPAVGWRVVVGLGWDDLRPVGLKLIFLIVSCAVSLPGLSRREWWWKDAEILMLRHHSLLSPGASGRGLAPG